MLNKKIREFIVLMLAVSVILNFYIPIHAADVNVSDESMTDSESAGGDALYDNMADDADSNMPVDQGITVNDILDEDSADEDTVDIYLPDDASVDRGFVNSDEADEGASDDESAEEDTISGPVLEVSLPTTLGFCMDPLNINGKGTLFSSAYSVVNYSSVDIELEIFDLAYLFSGSGSYLSSSEPVEYDSERLEKSVYMVLRRIMNPQLDENGLLSETSEEQLTDLDYIDYLITDYTDGTTCKVLLKAANYDENGEFLSLNQDSIFLFTYTGDCHNGNFYLWQSGDLSIRTGFRWRPVINEESAEESVPGPSATSTPYTEPVDSPEPSVTPGSEPAQSPEPVPTTTPDSEPAKSPEPKPSAAPDSEPAKSPEPVPSGIPDPVPTQTPKPDPVETPKAEPTSVPDDKPSENADTNPSDNT